MWIEMETGVSHSRPEGGSGESGSSIAGTVTTARWLVAGHRDNGREFNRDPSNLPNTPPTDALPKFGPDKVIII